MDDGETAENIRRCELKFPNEAFSVISENGKDFMRKLLLKNKGARMSVHEALEHPWLAEDDQSESTQIPASAYANINAKIKAKYASWPEPNPSIGRLANFSALRKLRPKEYNIYSSYFDRRDAMPRFIRKPRSQQVMEGNAAEFKCLILAASPPVVSWHFNGHEIRQSMKHMKKYANNCYALEVKRCVIEDKGEYVVRAVNSYGEREYNVFLNVER